MESAQWTGRSGGQESVEGKKKPAWGGIRSVYYITLPGRWGGASNSKKKRKRTGWRERPWQSPCSVRGERENLSGSGQDTAEWQKKSLKREKGQRQGAWERDTMSVVSKSAGKRQGGKKDPPEKTLKGVSKGTGNVVVGRVLLPKKGGWRTPLGITK